MVIDGSKQFINLLKVFEKVAQSSCISFYFIKTF